MNKLFNLLKLAVTPAFYYELYRFLLYYVYEHTLPLGKITHGKNLELHPTVSIRFGENIRLGNDVVIDAHCCLWASEHSKIHLGNNTAVGQNTSFISSNHKFQKGQKFSEQELVEKDIRIGDDVWIGCNSVILAGVTVGSGSVIGAGVVVSQDIPENSLVVGKSRQLTILPRT